MNMDDYIPVNERIASFYAKHPEGSLQSELVELSESRVVMRAYAYRSPDDPKPGMGYASGIIPGPTPFTRGSEVENAETSAWGRAIAALGFEVKKGIATTEDVASKQETTKPVQRPVAVPSRSSTAVPEPDLDEDPYGDSLGLGVDECPVHHKPWKTIPAGTSAKTGKPYGSFQACPEMGCREKPAA